MRKWLERWSGFDRVLRVLNIDPTQGGPEFITRILSEFGLQPVGTGYRGPDPRGVVFVCTHHTGAADFLAAYAILEKSVPNLKVVMNDRLLKLPPLARIGIGVHAISTKRENGEARARIQAHLESGGNLLVFPAGKVGVLRNGRVTDQPWRLGVARMIRESAAWVVPVHVDARNGAGFYLLRELFPRFGMLFLLRMLRHQEQRPTPVRVGDAIAAADLGLLGDQELLARLRKATYELNEERENVHVLVPA
jgi:putative hemolysin